jgi:phosphoribosylformimino-5-aminoimidazole carboxamide ribotide isomerase
MARSSTFRVIPAVDLKSGRCVTLVGGDPSRRLAERPDPVTAAREWESRGASLLHVIDLDGAIEGVPANRQILMDIVDALGIPVQFGGGIRSVEAARDLLEGGVRRVILGTLALKNPGSVETLSREYGPGRVMVALDFRGGRVLTHGWRTATDASPMAAAAEYERLGAGSILHTNVEVEGRLGGLPLEPVRELVRAIDIDVIAAGGISTIGDILEIRSTGAAGVVVGAAIYTGRIDLEEAIKTAEG